jgi:hypothetical protein
MGCKSKKPKAVSKSRPRITETPVLLKSKPKRRKAKPLPPDYPTLDEMLEAVEAEWEAIQPKRKSLLARIASWFIP